MKGPATENIDKVLLSRSVLSVSLRPPWTVTHQAPLSMRISSGKNPGVGWPSPSPGDLPNPGIEPMFPALAGGSFTTEPPGKSYKSRYVYIPM